MRSQSPIALAALLVFASTACSLGLSPRPDRVDIGKGGASSDATTITIPRSTDPPRELPGVDTSDLAAERKQAFWDVANRLYAPCSDQAVTLVQCLEQQRPCGACTPAATLLADQVRRGVAKAQAASAVNARFAADAVKKVDVGKSPTKGPENAPVTIVVFSDFQCPACKATLPVFEEAMKANPGQVRLVHKFYPLEKHTRARQAAYAAVAAMKQGKYWDMEKILFANQEALSDEDLTRYAEKLGLDAVKFNQDLRSDATKELVDVDVFLGEEVGVRYTPFVLINGRVFDTTYFKYDRDLDEWIKTEAALAKKPEAAKPEATKPEAAKP